METTRIYNDPKDKHDVVNKSYVDKVHTEYTDNSIKTTLNNINNSQLVFDNIFTNKIASSNLLNLHEAYEVSNYDAKPVITMNSVVVTAKVDLNVVGYAVLNLMDLRGLEGKTITISWDISSNRADVIAASVISHVELHYMAKDTNRKVITYFANSGCSFTVADDLGEFHFLQVVFMLYNATIGPHLETTIKAGDWIEFKNLQINLGTKKLPYMPYKKYGYNSIESMGSIVVDDIRSKNLFDVNQIPLKTENGVTISKNSEGGLILNGTATSQIEFSYTELSNESKIKSRNTYTLSSNALPENNLLQIFLQNTNGNTWVSTIANIKTDINPTTFTVPALSGTHLKYLILILEGATFNNFVIYPQIEEGSSATNYSEYIEFNNTAVLVDDFIVAHDGFSVIDETIYKQNNRYFGDVVIKKETGVFIETNERACRINKKIMKSVNGACILAKTQWSAFGVGYMFITENSEIIISDYASNSCNFAKIHIDVVV